MDNRLVIKNLNGEDLTIEVIDILEDTELNREYICYKLPDMNELYVSRLIRDENTYRLESISEEEKKSIEEELKHNLEGK